MGATANPPKSDDRYAQLTRGAFIINDFLRNPRFNMFHNSHFFENVEFLQVDSRCCTELNSKKNSKSEIFKITPNQK